MLLHNVNVLNVFYDLFYKSLLSLDADRAGGGVFAGTGARLAGPVQFQARQNCSGSPAELRAQTSGT